MKLRIDTVIDADADTVWHHVRRPVLLDHVAWPLQRFDPIDPVRLPDQWVDGEYRVRCFMFGFLPMGSQVISISYPATDAPARRLRDNGRGSMMRRWDHLITIRPRGDGRCDYRDEVEIEAGLMTLGVWLFASIFYRHRQRRWRALAQDGFSAISRGE